MPVKQVYVFKKHENNNISEILLKDRTACTVIVFSHAQNIFSPNSMNERNPVTNIR